MNVPGWFTIIFPMVKMPWSPLHFPSLFKCLGLLKNAQQLKLKFKQEKFFQIAGIWFKITKLLLQNKRAWDVCDFCWKNSLSVTLQVDH